MENIVRVAIIGAGRIGCGFDTPEATEVLTHAHAITKDARLKLEGFVDTNEKAGKAEAAKWGTTFFKTIDEMWKSTKPDIVAIATPDDTHAKLLEEVFARKPRLVICEKPIATNPGEMRMVRNLDSSIPVIVNFRRRFSKTVATLAKEFSEGKYGHTISVHGMYSGGLLHNGSHMIDLARTLFGEMLSAQKEFVSDGQTDPSVAAFLTFERCPVFHFSYGDPHVAVFELGILAEKRRFRLLDEDATLGSALAIQEIVDDPVYKGFKILSEPIVQKTDLINALQNLYKHVVAVLDGKEMPRSSLAEAIKTQDACFKILS